ncbi:MAG: S41 family peptidase [Ferruginibacter sp.]
MKKCLLILFITCCFGTRAQQPAGPSIYKADFDYFWKAIADEYCYFYKKQTDWERVKLLYGPMMDTMQSRNAFVQVLEKALYELYDHHAVLNTNTDSSRRLVPSGTDIWAAYIYGKPVITELRNHFGAARCGLLPGMEIIAINGQPVEEAVQLFLPRSLKKADTEARSFALRLALAGNHVQARSLRLRYQGRERDYFPDKDGMQLEHIRYNSKIESRLYGNTAYICINDCLYDNALIPLFDSVMQQVQASNGLVLDLRECPSGGNTLVAKAILGWFTNKACFYQQHEYYATEKENGIKSSWQEIVSPRPGKYYSKPLVILCDHWTGSIAEGITIGFDALQRKQLHIIGTEMARLNGAVYSYALPNTGIHFSFPAERLYHIHGRPREEYVPPVTVTRELDKMSETNDVFLKKALQYLEGKKQ